MVCSTFCPVVDQYFSIQTSTYLASLYQFHNTQFYWLHVNPRRGKTYQRKGMENRHRENNVACTYHYNQIGHEKDEKA